MQSQNNYSSTTEIKSIHDQLQLFSRDTESVDLSGYSLGQADPLELLEGIKKLSPKLFGLNLSKNNLYHLGCQWLVSIFKALPKDLYTLDIVGNNLEKFNESELVEIFAAIPRKVRNLYWDNFGLSPKLTSAKLTAILKVFPSVEYLTLRSRSLEMKGLSEAIQLIPATVEQLIFIGNTFEKLPGDEFVKILKKITTPIKELMWVGVWEDDSKKELDKFFSTVPLTVTSIVLVGNNFKNLTAAEIIIAFRAIPANVTQLNFENNRWRSLSPEECIQILKSIPITVTSLHFPMTEFQLSGVENSIIVNLRTIYKSIPPWIKTLSISGIKLPHILESFFMILPPTITSLTLMDYVFEHLTKEKWLKPFSDLPITINALALRGLSITSTMNDEEFVRFINSFPYQLSELDYDDSYYRKNDFLQKGRQHAFHMMLSHTPLHEDVAGIVLGYAGNKSNFWKEKWYEKPEIEPHALNKLLLR